MYAFYNRDAACQHGMAGKGIGHLYVLPSKSHVSACLHRDECRCPVTCDRVLLRWPAEHANADLQNHGEEGEISLYSWAGT